VSSFDATSSLEVATTIQRTHDRPHRCADELLQDLRHPPGTFSSHRKHLLALSAAAMTRAKQTISFALLVTSVGILGLVAGLQALTPSLGIPPSGSALADQGLARSFATTNPPSGRSYSCSTLLGCHQLGRLPAGPTWFGRHTVQRHRRGIQRAHGTIGHGAEGPGYAKSAVGLRCGKSNELDDFSTRPRGPSMLRFSHRKMRRWFSTFIQEQGRWPTWLRLSERVGRAHRCPWPPKDSRSKHQAR
jgi:hypothetical protein